MAIGVKPRADLAKQAGLKVDKGVLVNEYLQTTSPDVFAAGDVAEAFDPTSGRNTLDVLWPTALAQGRVAGANMAGAGRPYVKGIAFNVTMLTGLKVTIIGAVGSGKKDKNEKKDQDLVTIARGDSEAWRLLPQAWVLANRDDVNRVRLMVGERRIMGALVMGDQTWSRPLQRLVVGQADITPIRPTGPGSRPAPLAAAAALAPCPPGPEPGRQPPRGRAPGAAGRARPGTPD